MQFQRALPCTTHELLNPLRDMPKAFGQGQAGREEVRGGLKAHKPKHQIYSSQIAQDRSSMAGWPKGSEQASSYQTIQTTGGNRRASVRREKAQRMRKMPKMANNATTSWVETDQKEAGKLYRNEMEMDADTRLGTDLQDEYQLNHQGASALSREPLTSSRRSHASQAPSSPSNLSPEPPLMN